MLLKRAPFNGMRGKRAPFNGMRGKREEEEQEYQGDKRGKEVGKVLTVLTGLIVVCLF